MGKSELQPFASLGIVLKRLREKHSKSVAEVSGAVEVDEKSIHEYEKGTARPSEDILLLIIQHYDLKEDEADELWRLAGYNVADESKFFINDDDGEAKQVQKVGILAQDMKIVYTDMVQVMVNNYGVIINFLQGAGLNNQPLAVSRVGMSKEHAKSILAVLQKTLEQAEDVAKEPKRLQAGSDHNE